EKVQIHGGLLAFVVQQCFQFEGGGQAPVVVIGITARAVNLIRAPWISKLRSCYLRRAAMHCTQVLALGGMFAYPLSLISGYQALAIVVVGFEVDSKSYAD
ncbi:MAG: hypothetical protein LRY75_16800, partial [Shewanella xiamenensis]|nr:hypothetical protein [Shewanella xiamenensis]